MDEKEKWITEFTSQVADNIRAAISAQGLTYADIEELSEKAGFKISKQILGTMGTKYKKNISIAELVAIAAILNIHPSVLIFDPLKVEQKTKISPNSKARTQTENYLWSIGFFNAYDTLETAADNSTFHEPEEGVKAYSAVNFRVVLDRIKEYARLRIAYNFFEKISPEIDHTQDKRQLQLIAENVAFYLKLKKKTVLDLDKDKE